MSSKPLDAGPELDAAVARALGWDFTITVHGEVMLASEAAEGGGGALFQPSRDSRLALRVANEAGVFNKHCLSAGQDCWLVYADDVCRCDKDAIQVESDTPDVVLCLATIAWLKTKAK